MLWARAAEGSRKGPILSRGGALPETVVYSSRYLTGERKENVVLTRDRAVVRRL